QLSFLGKMRPETLPPYVLVVNPENLTRCIDYSDRNTAVLFGDGSAAAVVSATIPSRLSLRESDCASKPASWQKAIIPRTGYFQQDGNAVQGFAIRKMTEAVRTLQETYAGRKEGEEEDGHDGRRLLFVGHQANLSVLSNVCERTAIPDDCHWRNVTMFGNTGCSGAPAVVSQHWQDLEQGDCLIMALVGAGLTWSTLMWQMS
ncbi:MAG: 3-oxoacyl-[acyl-carrier-protein] synthase III C-terminal domain-containing protein, partial [Syntrophales bacterium]